jgi:3-deoxy-D-manno-oct-2-ulosonic acid (Kdo) hydroxylase
LEFQSSDFLTKLNVTDWRGPIDAATREAAIGALEQGNVLVFEHLPFSFEGDEQGLLSPALSNGKSKNISSDASGEVRGAQANEEQTRLLAKMMGRFASQATEFIGELLPVYAPLLERARTSYRPVEIDGRAASVIHDDTRLHVDAFPSRPTRGRRIMRLFTNVNPDGGPRVWRVGERFEDMARKLGTSTDEGNALHTALLAGLGITKGKRSAYDSVMLRLHDGAKRDDQYQKTSPQIEVAFAPGTTWICFTDQVMHAAIAGQYALEQTFHLDIDAMAKPERSPLRTLERLRGHALV